MTEQDLAKVWEQVIAGAQQINDRPLEQNVFDRIKVAQNPGAYQARIVAQVVGVEAYALGRSAAKAPEGFPVHLVANAYACAPAAVLIGDVIMRHHRRGETMVKGVRIDGYSLIPMPGIDMAFAEFPRHPQELQNMFEFDRTGRRLVRFLEMDDAQASNRAGNPLLEAKTPNIKGVNKLVSLGARRFRKYLEGLGIEDIQPMRSKRPFQGFR